MRNNMLVELYLNYLEIKNSISKIIKKALKDGLVNSKMKILF